MLGNVIGVAKAAWAVRKMKGEFDPMDLGWMGGMVVIAFLLLWFILTIVMPDLPKWW